MAFATAILVACLQPAAAELQQPADNPGSTKLIETSRVDIVESWPFLVLPKKKEHAELCAGLSRDQIRVLDGGQEARIVSVDPAPPLAIHVLLLDTSSSMSDQNTVIGRRKSRQSKAAAKAYVDWMLEDVEVGGSEELVVATFDDDLFIQVPPSVVADSSEASRIKDRIEAMTGGFRTTLNDSVYSLILHLGTRPQRGVVILVSDGADTQSLRDYTDVAFAVEETNNVTLFSIGIGQPEGRYADFLESVAEISGGKYYWVRSQSADNLGGALKKKFEKIRARIEGQQYVSYLTAPLGAIESDRINAYGQVRRAVRIRSLDRRCLIPKDGYRKVRVGRPGADADGHPQEPNDRVAGEGQVDDGVLRLVIKDRVRDADPLILYPSEHEGPLWAERSVEVIIPPLELQNAKQPEDIIHEWLAMGLIPERAEPGTLAMTRKNSYPTKHEINGKTFLVTRDQMAEALFRTDESYREWARDLLGTRLRARYRELVPPPRDAEERSQYEKEIESVVLGRLRQATSDDYVQYLADWLFDIRARDLALRLERKEANLLLSGEAGAADRVDMIQSRWFRFHDWLSLPDRVRVLVPLELSCDREQDRCGFYRIVLPRFGELPEDMTRAHGKVLQPRTLEEFIPYDMSKVPRYPFGLMWIRWVLGLPVRPGDPVPELSSQRAKLSVAARGAGQVVAVEHHAVEVTPLITRLDKVIDTRPCFRRVTVDFDDAQLDVVVRIVPKERMIVLVPKKEYADRLHKCEVEEAVAVAPTCFYPGEPSTLSPLEAPLADLGVGVCQEPDAIQGALAN